MSKFIKFSQAEKEQARTTDLAEFLTAQGEEVKKMGSEYVWLDGGQKVTIRGNLWFHQYEQKGGDSIDFVRRYYHKGYGDAVQMLLGSYAGTEISHNSYIPNRPKPQQPKQPFVLPVKNDNMRRMFAYLLFTRGLDKGVVQEFVRRKMLYESKNYHNAVFVGYDQNGIAQHAHERGTISGKSYKHNAAGSKPEYSFHWNGTSSHLFLFEAPIDMLSFISMHSNQNWQQHSNQNWQQHSYAAACSVSDRVLLECLKNDSQIKNVYLCLDNDEAGQQANKRIIEKLKEIHPEINTQILIPFNKDWNEDLLMRNGGAEQCQAQRS